RAAEAGNPSAMNNLGLCYRNGEGTLKDDTRAAVCFHRAALLGNANAQYNMGRCYYHGLGVPQNTEEAKQWVFKAAAQQHKNAQLFMEDNQWQMPEAPAMPQ
ncbi:MAG: sel1 repeat family protein, partial [Akkermansia sp.]|nr:sel1 repeat family protein [Akkermansia sp.]